MKGPGILKSVGREESLYCLPDLAKGRQLPFRLPLPDEAPAGHGLKGLWNLLYKAGGEGIKGFPDNNGLGTS